MASQAEIKDENMSSPSSNNSDPRSKTDGLDDLTAALKREDSDDEMADAMGVIIRQTVEPNETSSTPTGDAQARLMNANRLFQPQLRPAPDTQLQYFNSIEAAIKADRYIVAPDDDDVAALEQNPQEWVLKIKTALQAHKQNEPMIEGVDVDLWKKMWSEFNKWLTDALEDEQETERIAWVMLGDVIDFHNNGFPKRIKVPKSAKAKVPVVEIMKASKRVDTMISYLAKCSPLAYRSLTNESERRLTVGAPDFMLADKWHNAITNAIKKAREAEQKAAHAELQRRRESEQGEQQQPDEHPQNPRQSFDLGRRPSAATPDAIQRLQADRAATVPPGFPRRQNSGTTRHLLSQQCQQWIQPRSALLLSRALRTASYTPHHALSLPHHSQDSSKRLYQTRHQCEQSAPIFVG